MPKQTIEVDNESLQSLRKISRVLGISVSEFIEDELAYVVEDIQTSLFGDLAERWFARTWSSRKQAERIAERIEAFALEEQLVGNENIGTIATTVDPTKDCRWTIQINELRRPGGPWITSLSGDEDQFNLGRDDDEGEQWKHE